MAHDPTQERNSQETQQREKNTLGDYFALGEVFTYFFRKKKPANINVRMMHWTNKISILMFLAAVVIWLMRHAF